MLTTSTWSPRFSSIADRALHQAGDAIQFLGRARLPDMLAVGAALSVPSTITARLIRSICGCSRISVRTVLLIS